MAKAKMFIEVEILKESGYVYINNILEEEDIKEIYNQHVEFSKKFKSRYETFEGFKLKYIPMNVKYDARKRCIKNEDVLNSMTLEGYTEKIADSLYGGYYKPTEKLNNVLNSHMTKRRELAGLAS